MIEIEADLRASLLPLLPILRRAHAEARGKTKELIGMFIALRGDLIEQLDRDQADTEPKSASPVEREIALLEQARRDYSRQNGQPS